MAGDHFTITRLGDFQLSLAVLVQNFSQIELVAHAIKYTQTHTLLIAHMSLCTSPYDTDSYTTLKYCPHTSTATHQDKYAHHDESFLSRLWLLFHLHASHRYVEVIMLRKQFGPEPESSALCEKSQSDWKSPFQG